MGDVIDGIKSEVNEISKVTNENSLAIRELITLSRQTTKDTDKLVKHLDTLIPIHDVVKGISDRVCTLEEESSAGIRPKTHKEMFYSLISVTGLFAIWISLLSLSTDKHNSIQDQEIKTINNKIDRINERGNHNRNQITYLKGRIKK